MVERKYPATDAALPLAMSFVEEQLDELGCPMQELLSVAVCVEEMFVNVAHYAYGKEGGEVTLAIAAEQDTVSITLIDEGVAFNPLEQEEPDITLSAEERPIGGLGIFLVKKTMDEVHYERKGSKNVFVMKKNIKKV